MSKLRTILRVLKEVFLSLLSPFIHLILVVILIKTGQWPNLASLSLWQFVLLCLCFFGLCLWFASYFFVFPYFYLYPKVKKLVTSGPYFLLRHPIYFGSLLTFLSLSLLAQSSLGLWYTTLVILPLNLLRANWEEKTLEAVFKEKYLRYKKQTPF